MGQSNPQKVAQALALYLAFTPWSEIARVTGLKQTTIERRSQREGWPDKRASMLPDGGPLAPDSAVSWVGAVRQECESALKRFQNYAIPTCLKEEKERIALLSQLDEIARRAYGIDKQGNSLQVNLNFMRDQPKSLQQADVQKVIDVGTVKPDSQSDA